MAVADNDRHPALADETATSRQHWKWSFVSAMAGYIDAGSIVAGAASLPLWVKHFHLSNSTVGLIGAFSSNAISAGVGALIGGYICDRYGRKKIYAYDLLVYMFGILWIIFAANSAMLIIGYILVGLAVGADIPASWTLIAEFAPANKRGRMSGLTQLLWNSGPVVVLALSIAFGSFGMLGARLVFAHLFLIAGVTWLLRHGVGESARWTQSQETEPRLDAKSSFLRDLKELSAWRGLSPLLFLAGMYGIWNLMAGTNGFYLPYLLTTFGSESDTTSKLLQMTTFILGGLGTVIVFMPLNDRVDRRLLLAVSTILQAGGLFLLVILHLNLGVALAYILITGVGGGFGQQHLFQVWSGELFPTRLRSTAQGLVFAVVRIALGIWSYLVPHITSAGFKDLAIILFSFTVVSGLIGVVFAPPTQGRELEEILTSRGWQESTRADAANHVGTGRR